MLYAMKQAWKFGYNLMGPATLKFEKKTEKIQDLARFQATSDFDCKYLQNESRSIKISVRVVKP